MSKNREYNAFKNKQCSALEGDKEKNRIREKPLSKNTVILKKSLETDLSNNKSANNAPQCFSFSLIQGYLWLSPGLFTQHLQNTPTLLH